MAGDAAAIAKHLLRKSLSEPTATKILTERILSHLKANRLRKAVSILFCSQEPVSYSLYAYLFHLCASKHAIVEAHKVESHLLTFSPVPPIFLLNRAIETYGKCGCLDDARVLFEEMPERDGGSWNAMLSAYTQNGFRVEALAVFKRMNELGISANDITFASVLGSCAGQLELNLSRQIHGVIVKRGFCGNVILGSSLVDVYGKCMVMIDARRMFNEIENKNNVSWNVIVRRYLEAGNGKEAIVMFSKMLREDIKPLNFTFANAIIACSLLSRLSEGMQIHGVVIKNYLEGDEVVLGSLIDMYIKCGKLGDARRIFSQPGERDLISWTTIMSGYAMNGRIVEARELFDKMPKRNVISWNAMLAGYTRYELWEEALDFVFLMGRTTNDIDHVTLGLLLNVCARLSDIEMGKQVHGFMYRHGFSSNILVSNALLDMYCKCGSLRSARIWFYHMSQYRDQVSWNSLLTRYARCRQSEHAMTFFSDMQWETKPSKYTFGTLLAACANIFALDQGKEIHCFMIRNAYEMDVVIRSVLVDFYSKCRSLKYALWVFEEETSRDVILWNSMLLGCYHNGKGRKALEYFGMMEEEGIQPDRVTFLAILQACTCEGFVKLGSRFFDAMSNKYYIVPDFEHYGCMIELYCQYGCFKELNSFLKRMPFDPTVSMLMKIFDACKKHRYRPLGKWAAKRLNDLDPLVEYAVTKGTRFHRL